MASIDICYAVAAYKTVAESENIFTRYTLFTVALADFVTTDIVSRLKDVIFIEPLARFIAETTFRVDMLVVGYTGNLLRYGYIARETQ